MKYFAIIDNTQQGPFELDELRNAGILPTTYVWCKGMADWKQAREVADICRYFRIYLSDGPQMKSAQNNLLSTPQQSDEDIQQIPLRYRHIIQKSGAEFKLQEPEEDHTVPPTTWMAYSILLTIICFPPTGFVAIYFALQSSKLWKQGNKSEAHQAAKKSRMWTLLTLFIGLIFIAFLLRPILIG